MERRFVIYEGASAKNQRSWCIASVLLPSRLHYPQWRRSSESFRSLSSISPSRVSRVCIRFSRSSLPARKLPGGLARRFTPFLCPPVLKSGSVSPVFRYFSPKSFPPSLAPCSICLNRLNAHTLERISADSVVVITRRCQRLNPGSSPGRRTLSWQFMQHLLRPRCFFWYGLDLPGRLLEPVSLVLPHQALDRVTRVLSITAHRVYDIAGSCFNRDTGPPRRYRKPRGFGFNLFWPHSRGMIHRQILKLAIVEEGIPLPSPLLPWIISDLPETVGLTLSGKSKKVIP